MAFAMSTERARCAVDADAGTKMFIKSGPQMEFHYAYFESATLSLKLQIEIREKFPDRPIARDDPTNPCILISAQYLNDVLAAHQLRDVAKNTALVRYLVRMIAFINKCAPLSNVTELTQGAFV